MRNIYLNLIIFFLLVSCSGFKEVGKVLRNEKVSNTDEFLVKKRAPLVLPPEYDTLPEPNSAKNSKKTDTSKINKILKIPDQSTSTSTGSSSVEESIMKNIRK